MHILVTCPFSKAVWMCIPGGSRVLNNSCNNIGSLLEEWGDRDKQMQESGEWVNPAMVVCLSIWSPRCDYIFQNKIGDPRKVASGAVSFVDYLKRIMLQSDADIPNNLPVTIPNEPIWIAPPQPYLKINCDASFLKRNKYGGIGLILHDFTGTWRGCRARSLGNVLSVEQVKCIAFLDAVKWSNILAKYSKKYNITNNWYDEPPNVLEGQVSLNIDPT
ncbi:uncharacterized protein LOC113312088 [Papaver somniferum]|uniref:uncharacterized protein LOC113312088 n=1 Tax=Papaver somniferum TaxID=3469 RepID=UPI000E703480|nr:uncharacterized protein LOC113312088 [Papaver somniferum]